MSSVPGKKSQKLPANRKQLTDRLMYLGQMASTETALFHQTAAAKNGLSLTDSKTISVLMQEGPMTAGQISERLSLTTGAVTSVIDRLETAGFASREHDPEDRRRVIVRLNIKNLQKLAATYDHMGTAFGELLDTYTIQELQFLVQYYEATIKQTQKEIARLGRQA